MPTDLAMDDVRNLREMGGLPAAEGGTVRSGQLFRSGHLSTATAADLGRLSDLRLRTVVDLRTDIDRRGDGGPDRLPPGPNPIEIPVVDTSGRNHEIREVFMSADQALVDARFGDGRAAEMAAEGVVAMALEAEKQTVFAQVLDVVADPANRPVLWHCTAGKDRAGWAATVIGMALGVPDDALVEHYLESNRHRPAEERLAHYADIGIDVTCMLPFLRVDEAYLRAGLAAVDEGWSSREAYLADALGFGPERVEQFRADLIV